MKVAIVMGTRPEIIKLSPIIKNLNKNNSTIIFTGQHYDYDMSTSFIEELDMRKPDYYMKIIKKKNKKKKEKRKIHSEIYEKKNTTIDAIEQNIKSLEKKRTIDIKSDDFVLVTIHRGENVDDPSALSPIITALLKSRINMIFPAHPRTERRLKQFGLYNKIENSNILLLPTVGYFDMLFLMKKCRFIISDSGGI